MFIKALRFIIVFGVVTFTMHTIAFAQDTVQRQLSTNQPIEGQLSSSAIAQVYTYAPSASGSITLSVTKFAADALAVFVTDASAQPLGQVIDLGVNEVLQLSMMLDDTQETLYITLFSPTSIEESQTIPFILSLKAQSQPSIQTTPTLDTNVTLPAPTVAPVITEGVAVTPTGTEVSTLDPLGQATTVTVEQLQTGTVLSTGGVQVTLAWESATDLNLEVRDPLGGTVYWDVPNSASGGAFDGLNTNGACENVVTTSPTESISWAPGNLPIGSYEILVFYVQDCQNIGAVPFTVNIAVDGVPLETIAGSLLPGQNYMSSFSLDANAQSSVAQGGINQETLPRPVAELLPLAQPIAIETSSDGLITNNTPFAVYAFEGTQGSVISASLTATSGGLDTYLFMIDPAGLVVASNDDADATSRNASIRSQTLNASGQYLLIATRYGQTVGGTEGNYILSLTGGTDLLGIPQSLVDLALPNGEIEIALLWDTNADLQLLVRDPSGDSVFDDSPIIESGGRLELGGNKNCSVAQTAVPASYVYWAEGQRLRPGTYEIDVWYQNNCNDTRPVSASLVGVIGGQVVISDSFAPLPQEHYITTFTVQSDGSIVRGPGGTSGGSETINYQGEVATAPVLTDSIPVSGIIADDNRFDVYTFAGEIGQTVTIRMDASTGTLDTLLFLISPTGIELAANDDAIPNETTNSLIQEFVLPQSGQYAIIATHYGTIYGGTNGSYTLLFSRLN
ncbi:MAG UNVERIFIED_CONTAM: PPC domain-containing protein [Anaerolineae bacterium]|jgi:uncharacterized protein YfaP (DUF2135 family)